MVLAVLTQEGLEEIAALRLPKMVLLHFLILVVAVVALNQMALKVSRQEAEMVDQVPFGY
jgi:hypothetical protein